MGGTHLRTVIGLTLASFVLVGSGFLAGARVRAGGAEPGTAADPLVSKSYVDEYVQSYVNQRLEEEVSRVVTERLEAAVEEQLSRYRREQVQPYVQQEISLALARYKPPEPPRFHVVNLPAGHTLWGDTGTELVLRGGVATAQVGPSGGLADLTAGRDLAQDERIPANHLLVIPRADGRGLRAQTDVVLMVRGAYVLQEAGAE